MSATQNIRNSHYNKGEKEIQQELISLLYSFSTPPKKTKSQKR
jgi:hypothetical protein